jgi:phage baseplate assembly protein gpV
MSVLEELFAPIMDFVEQWQRTQPQLGLARAEVARVTDEGYILTYHSGDHSAESAPARVSSFMAGRERGAFFMPEVGDEVIVGFEMGNINQPVILGSMWSDVDAPPPGVDTSSSNNIRTIRSRAGHEITFDDSAGASKIKIKTAGAAPQPGFEITLEDGPSPKISIKTTGAIATSKIVLDGVAWNHQHATGTGPSGPPLSIVPVV